MYLRRLNTFIFIGMHLRRLNIFVCIGMHLRRLKLIVLIAIACAAKVTLETKIIAHVYKHEFAARLRRSIVSEKNDFSTAQMFRDVNS